MHFNQNNIFGIVLGWCTALWGYLTSTAQWTTQMLGDLPINTWAVWIGIVGVLANLYFAWARHRREVLVFEYESGLRAERRSRPTREGDAP